MIPTGKNRSTGREVNPSTNLFNAYLTMTKLKSNPGLPGECPAANNLSHDTANNRNFIYKFRSYGAVNTLRLGYKTGQLMLYSEIIAVCSQIHTKHMNTMCG
jgi:hypothetical protein